MAADDGRGLSVIDVVGLVSTLSDNLATNVLLAQVGLPAVEFSPDLWGWSRRSYSIVSDGSVDRRIRRTCPSAMPGNCLRLSPPSIATN